MAKYIMQEANLPFEDGEKRLFPRFVNKGTMEHEQLVDYISKASGLQKGAVMGVLGTLAERMATWMGEGYSIRIDGLGRFTPTLGLREGVEREEADEAGTHRNAQSIEVSNVNFVADKHFVNDINQWMELERSQYHATIRPNKCPYTEQERLSILQEYLQKHSFINVTTYMSISQLKRTAATTELRRWAHAPESPITFEGRAPHRVYTLKKD